MFGDKPLLRAIGLAIPLLALSGSASAATTFTFSVSCPAVTIGPVTINAISYNSSSQGYTPISLNSGVSVNTTIVSGSFTVVTNGSQSGAFTGTLACTLVFGGATASYTRTVGINTSGGSLSLGTVSLLLNLGSQGSVTITSPVESYPGVLPACCGTTAVVPNGTSDTVLFTAPAPPATLATTIGEGTCSSSTLSGAYALELSGRGVTPAQTTFLGIAAQSAAHPLATTSAVTGDITSVFSAVGTATFDGLSSVTLVFNQDNNLAVNVSTNWSGTYSVQANCVGTVNISTGGSATFNLVISTGGTGFAITGKDRTYAYEGTGNTQATGCSTATLSGVYVFSATQGFFSLTSGAAGGAAALTGLLEFDGKGDVQAIATLSANALINGVTGTEPGLTVSGTYSLGSNCIGVVNVSAPILGAFVINLSVYTGNSTLSSNMYMSIATNPVLGMAVGNAYWIYALPATASGTALAPADSSPPRVPLAGKVEEGAAL